jgi:CDP-diacylglycerol pyrophosphatase
MVSAMNTRDSRAIDRVRLAGTLAGVICLSVALAAPATANRNALREIVQGQCAAHWLQQHSAAPCERIILPDSAHLRDGFAVLADRKGGAHFLLIPTQTLAGMESPELFVPGTPNYFAAAWAARDLVAAVVGRGIPRAAVGMALNPKHARSQDQFHIHIECIRKDVAKTLQKAAPAIGDSWSPLAIGAWSYEALRIMGEDLAGSDPISLLADKLPAAKAAMGEYTLVVAGMDFNEGPGFIALASTGPAGELLLDSTCAIAAPSPSDP